MSDVHFYIADAPTIAERVLCQTSYDWRLIVTEFENEVTCADCVLALIGMDR